MAVSSNKVAREILALAQADARPVTPLELIKLTYLAHGWSLGLDEKPLVAESPEAWQYGPVFPDLYHSLKHFRANPVDSVPLGDDEADDKLTAEEMRIIRSVYKSYKKYNGVQLSAMTHQPGTPWDRARKRRAGSQILDDSIRDHFRELAVKRNVRPKG